MERVSGLAFASQKQKTTAITQKRKCKHFLFTRNLVVWDTRLELATSRPPGVRATNCANPRYVVLLFALQKAKDHFVVSEKLKQVLVFRSPTRGLGDRT